MTALAVAVALALALSALAVFSAVLMAGLADKAMDQAKR
jgi:hypothetical protein